MTNIVIAGSRRTPPSIAHNALGSFLAALPPRSCIYLRRGISTPPGPFELAVAILCHDSTQPPQDRHPLADIQWFIPEPSEGLRGRASVFVRDHTMFEGPDAASLLLAFLDESDLDTEPGGTEHLIQSAMDHHVAAYAWVVEHDNLDVTTIGEIGPHWMNTRLRLLGSEDPENEWAVKLECVG